MNYLCDLDKLVKVTHIITHPNPGGSGSWILNLENLIMQKESVLNYEVFDLCDLEK